MCFEYSALLKKYKLFFPLFFPIEREKSAFLIKSLRSLKSLMKATIPAEIVKTTE